ncbi:MAG: HEAT repeat domain-containing protein [Planctomycetales bacterium]|nr:HEAT repeat domain-containing protein [Planctomycetales bacterium]
MQRPTRQTCGRFLICIPTALAALLIASFSVAFAAAERPTAGTSVFAPAEGPGNGRRVVLLAGDEEYRSEEALVQLAKILAVRQGFHCTVLFAIDEATGEIDPNASHSLAGAEALDSADAIVMGLRFREYPDETMKHFVDAYLAGKPIVALRTSTHAFKYSDDSTSIYRDYSFNSKQWPGGFGRQVLGETWVSHLGKNHAEATRGLPEPSAQGHPVLHGVGEIFADTGAYVAAPPEDCTVLIRGQVLAGTTATSPPLEGEKNNPLQPVAWTRIHRNAAGKTNRLLCTTMGAATDLLDENLRRLLVNGLYWALDDEVPAAADVALVGDYQPTDYSFDGFRRGVRPADLQLEPADASLPLDLKAGERIALVGGVLPPRMALYGHFETMLHVRFPEKELRVRNFGWPTDEAGDQQRPNDYTALDDPLKVFGPTLLVCFFGGNESFAGPAGIGAFKQGLAAFVQSKGDYLEQNGAKPRFVFVSPTAFEDPASVSLPDGVAENANLQLYRDAMRAVAEQLEVPFVDLYEPTAELFAATGGAQYTINGLHVNEAGAKEVAQRLDRSLFVEKPTRQLEDAEYERLRAAVLDKMWHHQNDYRMLNGWYVYGGRNTPFGVVNFPEEFVKLRKMVAARDRYLWDIAQGKTVSYLVDDGPTGELMEVPTTFGTKEYSEPDELRVLSPAEAEEAMEVAPGYRLQTFASEEMFPELANPVQLNFDNRGRLWASCMPTYPQWRPGDPKPNDRLLIFEDTDRDGVADEVKVFVDDLHCPTGFEFYNGGVLVVSQPQILFLKDTDGDDRADVREVLFDGFASDDTHHAICSFEWTPGGQLIMLEGISMLTSVETPWGPFRNRNKSVAYRLDPRTWRIDRHMMPCYANPWCYTQNNWGQEFVGDGTGADQYWATPLTGKVYPGRGGTKQFISYEGDRMRPAGGNEFVSSRQFPEDAQGNFLYSCVINTNAILQFTVKEAESGYAGVRIADFVKSSDDNFRPMDPRFGPDGTLYFADWHNPLIGHMQYSQRDPNRDHRHGRIYRLSAEGRPAVEPVTQAGKSIEELLEQLREVELRTRYAARRELRDRDTSEVLETIGRWTAQIDKSDPLQDRVLTEALWVEQGHHAVDVQLLQRVMQAETADARAAAAHVISGEFLTHPETLNWLEELIHDPHPRVRLEALRALSFVGTAEAVELALEVVDHEMDYYLNYTLESTLGALKPVIDAELAKGRSLGSDRPKAQEFLGKLLHGSVYGAKAHALIAKLSDQAASDSADKQRLYAELAALRGDAKLGEAVFQRTCVACHKIGETGAKFGPNHSDVGLRLSREEIVLSIIEPNAKLDPKYQTIVVTTNDGRAFSGLVAEESDDTLTMLIGAGKLQEIAKDSIDERDNVSVSSMPERLQESMAPKEFIDLLEYMAQQKTKPEQP